jgi:tRNA dimethylallyltransferase
MISVSKDYNTSAKSRTGKEKIIFLAGPTASGKTDISIALAKKINAEIISCDSMQVYKGMDILTAKPTAFQLKSIRHHLFGTVPAARDYSVSKFRSEAVKIIERILKKGKVPLFVGGTGLYISALIDGLFQQGRPDMKVRNKLYAEALKTGSPALHERLRLIDPAAAAKIHPNDTRRIVRAIEVYISTGKPISELQKLRSGLYSDYDVRIFCINMDRKFLYNRINKRVDRMFRLGLINEVQKLLRNKLSKTARYAIGINELKKYFDSDISIEEAKECMKHNSRLYAKRQLTWFRKDKRIKWVTLKPGERASSVAERINKLLGAAK